MPFMTVKDIAKGFNVHINDIHAIIHKNREKFKNLRKVGSSFLLDGERHVPIIKDLLAGTRKGKHITVDDDPVAELFLNPGGDPQTEQEVMCYADARTKREYFTAKQAKLDYERRSAKLVPTDAIQSLWASISLTVQKALLTVPDRIAPLCVGEDDQAVIHKRIKDEIRYSLKNLVFELKGISTEVITTETGDGETHKIILHKGMGRPLKADRI